MLKKVIVIAILFSPALATASLRFHPVIPNLDRGSNRAHHGQSEDPVLAIGTFTNIRGDQDHSYGYSAQLWRERNRIFGFFLSAQGLTGDTPTGMIEDVEFDPRTGKLAFQARLTTGLFSNRQFDSVPSRDVFRFRGVLKGDRMTGILEVANALTPAEAPKWEKIKLKRSRKESEVMVGAQNYDDWRNMADKILKVRGPNW